MENSSKFVLFLFHKVYGGICSIYLLKSPVNIGHGGGHKTTKRKRGYARPPVSQLWKSHDVNRL